jgi:hypothetical protein
MRLQSLVLAATLLAGAPVPLRAQGGASGTRPSGRPSATVPDFTGTWELDVGKSDFGGGAASALWIMRVRHAGPRLEVVRELRDLRSADVRRDSVAYLLGGPAVDYAGAVGATTASAALDGDQLVIKAVTEQQGQPSPHTTRWALAPGGTVLTLTRVIGGPPGAHTIRLVFNRK